MGSLFNLEYDIGSFQEKALTSQSCRHGPAMTAAFGCDNLQMSHEQAVTAIHGHIWTIQNSQKFIRF